MTKQTEDRSDYAAARQEWLERYGSYIARAKNWRTMAFTMAVVSVGLTAGLIYEADRVHVVPYIVEVNKLGQDVHLAQAVRAGVFKDKNLITQHVIANWITRMRERLTENLAEQATFMKDYNFDTAQVGKAANAYFAKHSPYAGAANGARTVKITSCLPMSGTKDTWQVQWQETQYSTNGAQIMGRTNWQAVVHVEYKNPPTTEKAEENPFGIYITAFSWQQTL